MRIEADVKLNFDDVLIRPKRSTLSSRKDVELVKSYQFRYSPIEWEGIPIIAANMDGVGTISMAESLSEFSMETALAKKYWTNHKIEHLYGGATRSWITIGMSQRELDELKEIHRCVEVEKICLDVANGYQEDFVSFVDQVREDFPAAIIMAGNVVTADITEALLYAGADIVKVGIGGGSVCTTRELTGVGYPQLSAIIECADAAHGLGGHVCADGGCRTPGDVAKAFGAGADFVMLGGMLAAHEENEEQIIVKDGQKYFEFYGMSSEKAMQKHHGGQADYRASEGKLVTLPCRGPVSGTVQEILGGLRSACTYVGAKTLKEFPKRTTFIRVQGQQQLNNVFG